VKKVLVEKAREKGGEYRKRGMHKGNEPPGAILCKGPGSMLLQFMWNLRRTK
jgi:hypothetical protein